eukprot:5638278-Pyramimonas_sp.AAC.1
MVGVGMTSHRPCFSSSSAWSMLQGGPYPKRRWVTPVLMDAMLLCVSVCAGCFRRGYRKRFAGTSSRSSLLCWSLCGACHA